MGRYIIVAYNDKTDSPKICFRMESLEVGKRKVDELKKQNVDRCVVLYDCQNNDFVKIVMTCEPIYFVKAVELARGEWVKLKKAGHLVKNEAVKGVASVVVGEIAKRLAGAPVPGISAAFMGHILAPYYALKGDGAAMGGAAAGMYGGLGGAVIGFCVGGPIGAVIGGAAGGAGLGIGTSTLIRALSHPNQCNRCKGVGMDTYYVRCGRCNGYGYTKAMN